MSNDDFKTIFHYSFMPHNVRNIENRQLFHNALSKTVPRYCGSQKLHSPEKTDP